MKLKRLLIFLLIIFLLSVFAYFKQTGFSVEDEKIEARVVRIIDGDTIKVIFNESNGTQESVRLLGINTPEKNMFFYEEAKQFLMKINGSFVELRFGQEKKDKYDRYLAYVFYNGNNNEFINEGILKNGLATKLIYQEDKYTKQLAEAEDYARQRGIGLWAKSSDKCAECIEVEIYNGEGKDDCQAGVEYVKLINSCNFECSLQSWTLKDEANHIYKFDSNDKLNANSFLMLYSGTGQDSELSLFWQNKGCASIWNDDGDSAFLRDETGKLVVWESY